MQQIEVRAMGVSVTALIDSWAPAARRALDAIPTWFGHWEQILSRFRPESELSRLNATPGTWHKVSTTLWDAIAAAREAALLSNNLVTPLVGAAMLVIGYDRCFEQIGQVGLSADIPARSIPAWHSLQCDPRRQAICVPVGTRLDLGGTAKGWAAQQACQLLSQHGPTLVSVGGDMAISGLRADGSGWPIGIADPVHPQQSVETLYLIGGGVATSGQDYRTWTQGTKRQHHIIDPRTGMPAATDLLTVTAIAPTAVEAEAIAKAVFIQGSEAGLAWLAERPQYAALLQCLDGRQLRSTTLADFTGLGRKAHQL